MGWSSSTGWNSEGWSRASVAASSAMSFITASTPKQYITTTWTHTSTDFKKATVSFWMKYIISPPGGQYLFTTASNGTSLLDFTYQSASFKHTVQDDIGSLYNVAKFLIAPDSGVWHHILLQIDTTQAAADDRIKIYVDGTLGTDAPTTSPIQNSDMGILPNGVASYLGEVSYQVGSSPGIPDSKFAYFYVIDGQSLTPSSFTTGTGAGTIHPITYAGTFGANGCFLNGVGSSLNDHSGSTSNNWTAPNSITFDSDIPT